MAKYEITRQLFFCYGHRLLHHPGRCAHLHGHNAILAVVLGSDTLDELGMVVDFQRIRDTLGAWIDQELDHKMILRQDDPAVSVLRDLGEPLHLIEKDPTAENLAALLFQKARSLELPVIEVSLWETPHCKATYRGGA